MPPRVPMLSTTEAGKLLRVSSETIRNWIHKGRLHHIESKGHFLVRKQDIEQLLTERGAELIAESTDLEFFAEESS